MWGTNGKICQLAENAALFGPVKNKSPGCNQGCLFEALVSIESEHYSDEIDLSKSINKYSDFVPSICSVRFLSVRALERGTPMSHDKAFEVVIVIIKVVLVAIELFILIR